MDVRGSCVVEVQRARKLRLQSSALPHWMRGLRLHKTGGKPIPEHWSPEDAMYVRQRNRNGRARTSPKRV
eukprot:scaffold986_cov237-Pinguiococcus_pyrenoidosus.AAC.7